LQRRYVGMKRKLFTLIGLSLITFVSCSSIEPEEDYISSQIYPLAMGNQWEYKYEVFQKDSLILSSITKIEVIDKIKIQVDKKELDVFKVKQTKEAYWTKETLISYTLYNYEDSMLFSYGFAITNDSAYFYRKDPYLKYPLQKGDQWYEDHGDYRNTFTCMSVNEEVTIDDKKYNCVRIRTGNGNSWYHDKYYAQGFGLIQEIAELKTDSKRFEKTTLLKLKINKPT
jgi:hypothetical protein